MLLNNWRALDGKMSNTRLHHPSVDNKKNI